MVEWKAESLNRVNSPTPVPHPVTTSYLDSRYGPAHGSSSSPRFHDRGDMSTPTVIANKVLPRAGNTSPDFLDAGARTEMSKPSIRRRASTGSQRRDSRSLLEANVQGSSQAPSPTPIPSPPLSSEKPHLRPTPNFQGSSVPAHVPYGQKPGFVDRHATTTRPTPMPMVQAAPVYGVLPYRNPIVTNTSVVSQNIHANYQPMPRAPAAHVFSYQNQTLSTDNTRATTMYHPHQVASPTSPSQHIAATQVQNITFSPSYGGSRPFQSLQHPSAAPFPYPQSFSPSTIFQSQYAHPPFGQPYAQSVEPDPHGAWYYLPHAPVSARLPYDNGQAYQHHPPAIPHPRLGHRELESPYDANPSSPVSPLGHSFSQHSEGHSSAGSPRAPWAGAPAHSAGDFISGPSSLGQAAEKPLIRRSYHPNPPAHRSDWVMWAGNVPADATYSELWTFFNQACASPSTDSADCGVVSIFLISRTNCAFVNYKSEEVLREAIVRFNGAQLRPSDARCPRLACRVRRVDDDLRAGVGGQRGMGIHTRWVKEQEGKQPEVPSEPSDLSSSSSSVGVSEEMATAISSNKHGDMQNRQGVYIKHSSSDGSYSSTNSSFLAEYFPTRYFILKSLTHHDLDLSVERGLWATQRHNEEILDQAFRSSKEVYLIFSVNKSGEFYGYARMAGPVCRGEKRVSWASRTPRSSNSDSSHLPLSGRVSKDESFSPNDRRLVDRLPLPIGASPSSKLVPEEVTRHSPAWLGDQYDLPTLPTPEQGLSLDQCMPKAVGKNDFHLDANAPQREVKCQESSSNVVVADTQPHLPEIDDQQKNEEEHVLQLGESRVEAAWGDSFAVEWVSTVTLPFQRTRHFRNPWNNEREVKVSRDGTELEPTVGERLLEEWEKFAKRSQREVPFSKDD